MSLRVELEELQERVAEYGPLAFLVTVGGDAAPHVVSVRVELADGELVAGAGRTTSANVAARPGVTLLWPVPSGSDYALIVDGPARVEEADGAARAVVRPVRAVLHRLVDASGDLPSCVTVLDQRAGADQGS